VNKKNPKPEIKQRLINSKELAELTGMSYSWVVKNRHNMIGVRRVGKRGWMFIEEVILRAIASGKNIVVYN